QRVRIHVDEARKTLEQLRVRSRRELGPESETTIALTGWLANSLVLLGQPEKAVAEVDGLPESRAALASREKLAEYLYFIPIGMVPCSSTSVSRPCGPVSYQVTTRPASGLGLAWRWCSASAADLPRRGSCWNKTSLRPFGCGRRSRTQTSQSR